MQKFTERTINKILKVGEPLKVSAIFLNGKIKTCITCGSKSRHGVKYNKLISLTNNISEIQQSRL